MLTSLRRLQGEERTTSMRLHVQCIRSYRLTSPVNGEEFRKITTGIPWSDGPFLCIRATELESQ
jgi:hypothetical protein